MRALFPLFALGLTAISGMADSTDELCIGIARMVESGGTSEKQALEVLQKAIDQAKKDLEAYKPPDATIVERLLSAKELTASMTIDYLPGCDPIETEPVRFVRKQDKVTAEVDKTRFVYSKSRRQTFSLTGEAEGEKALRDSFETWFALVREMAASPPESKSLAESTPAELLKRGRRMQNLMGGSSHCCITVTLKDEKGDLVIKETTGAHLREAFKWHKSLLKALPDSGSKPTAEPAAR
jgi:hypothetical protein